MTKTSGSGNSDQTTFPEMVESTRAESESMTSKPVDPKASAEQSSLFDEKVLTSRENRKMRFVAFVGLGIFVCLYLLCLLWALVHLANKDAVLSLMFLSNKADWHVWAMVAFVLAIFASIPLTLANSLVKMIRPSEEKSEDKLVIPHHEAFKSFLQALKDVFGK